MTVLLSYDCEARTIRRWLVDDKGKLWQGGELELAPEAEMCLSLPAMMHFVRYVMPPEWTRTWPSLT